MPCLRCGKQQRDNASFCRGCGQKLSLSENRWISLSKKGSKVAGVLFFGLVVTIVFSLVVRATVKAVVTPTPEVQLQGVGELYGVIIGVSDYQYLDDVPGPDDGASEISEQLKSIWGERAHLQILLNDGATKNGIQEAISRLASEVNENDLVLFYFTGHGNAQWITPYDSLSDSYSHDISATQLDDWLDSLGSKHMFVVIDSCESGGYARQLSQDGRVILASCDASEDASCEISSYLVQGLTQVEKTDRDEDGTISAEELCQYAGEIMSPQHPRLFDSYSGELELVSYSEKQ